MRNSRSTQQVNVLPHDEEAPFIVGLNSLAKEHSVLAKGVLLLSISRSAIPRDSFNTLTATPERIELLAKELAQKLCLLAALFEIV